MSVDLTHQHIETNGIKLHVVTAGDPSAEPIFLLHGFPETWQCWDHQIPFLVENGYYVIAPDQRGYNLSDKPEGVQNYRIDILAQDIIGLIEAMGYEKVYLGAHDWGAAVAWQIATHHPQYLKKCAILNVPHPSIVTADFRRFNLKQIARSWYMFFFQIPLFPEWFARQNDWWDAALLRKSSHPDTFTEEEIAHYKDAWSQPNAMRSMINWYRAAFRYSIFSGTPSKGSITVPILMLWGEQDIALGKHLAKRSIQLCNDGELIFFPDATHWITHDEPATVSQHFTEFFQ